MTQPTAKLQVNHTQVDQDIAHLTSDQQGFDPSQEPLPAEGAAFQTSPGSEVQVSPNTTSWLEVGNAETKVSANNNMTPGENATLKKFCGHLVTLLNIIYNLATHTPHLHSQRNNSCLCRQGRTRHGQL